MTAEFNLHCGVSRRKRSTTAGDDSRHYLEIGSKPHQIHVDVTYLPKRLAQGFKDVYLDLMEVASYVFTADQLCTRGGDREVEYGTKRRRNLRFEIAVRSPDKWNSPEVNKALCQVLRFMSDDDYSFKFVQNRKPKSSPAFIRFEANTQSPSEFGSLMLFSGGLDSLGGAVREILQNQKRVVLVSHTSTSKIAKPQSDLLRRLNERANPGTPIPLHVQYTVNKGKSLSRDNNQRTRAFLFCSFAAIIARAVGLSGFQVFENGVVSINLSPSMQVLGSRASRTTHPQTIAHMQDFLQCLFNEQVQIQTPFMLKTKQDVIAEIKAAGHGQLCSHAISCAHTIARTLQHSHCGTCSQCVDRRLAALAANATDAEDPSSHYRVSPIDVINDARDVTMIERYIGTAREILESKTSHGFLAKHGDAARALKYMGLSSADALEAAFSLHQRHARSVTSGIECLIDKYKTQIASGRVPARSLLGLALPASATANEKAILPDNHESLFVVDTERFQARYDGKEVEFANSIPFHLLRLLATHEGRYISVSTISKQVWQAENTTSKVIQKSVSVLRRQLEPLGPDVTIDGSRDGHYALRISANGKD